MFYFTLVPRSTPRMQCSTVPPTNPTNAMELAPTFKYNTNGSYVPFHIYKCQDGYIWQSLSLETYK